MKKDSLAQHVLLTAALASIVMGCGFFIVLVGVVVSAIGSGDWPGLWRYMISAILGSALSISIAVLLMYFYKPNTATKTVQPTSENP